MVWNATVIETLKEEFFLFTLKTTPHNYKHAEIRNINSNK